MRTADNLSARSKDLIISHACLAWPDLCELNVESMPLEAWLRRERAHALSLLLKTVDFWRSLGHCDALQALSRFFPKPVEITHALTARIRLIGEERRLGLEIKSATAVNVLDHHKSGRTSLGGLPHLKLLARENLCELASLCMQQARARLPALCQRAHLPSGSRSSCCCSCS